MPQSSSSLGAVPTIRGMFLAAPKTGKTTTVASTATKAFGAGYIVCASTAEHLRGAKDLTKGGFEFDIIKNLDDMDAAIKTARTGVKEGKYNWIMVDDFGAFTDMALDTFAIANKGNGRIYWDQYNRHVTSIVGRFLDIRTHVFFTLHYVETGPEMEGQVTKSGPGILPAIQGGKLRQTVPGQFNQVVWMEKNKVGERIFRLSVEGVTGPGCNNLPDDVKDIPADVGTLLDVLSGKMPANVTAKTVKKL